VYLYASHTSTALIYPDMTRLNIINRLLICRW